MMRRARRLVCLVVIAVVALAAIAEAQRARDRFGPSVRMATPVDLSICLSELTKTRVSRGPNGEPNNLVMTLADDTFQRWRQSCTSRPLRRNVVATSSRRNADSASPNTQRTPRRVKKSDAAPANRDVAQESAAISPDTSAAPPSPDEIAAEAYCIYCERGGGHGRDMDDWLEAERRLSASRAGQRPE